MFQNIFSNADDAAKIICGDDPNKAVMVRYLRKREIVYLAVDDETVGWAATCEESADVVGDLIRACPLHFPYDEPQKALEWVAKNLVVIEEFDDGSGRFHCSLDIPRDQILSELDLSFDKLVENDMSFEFLFGVMEEVHTDGGKRLEKAANVLTKQAKKWLQNKPKEDSWDAKASANREIEQPVERTVDLQYEFKELDSIEEPMETIADLHIEPSTLSLGVTPVEMNKMHEQASGVQPSIEAKSRQALKETWRLFEAMKRDEAKGDVQKAQTWDRFWQKFCRHEVTDDNEIGLSAFVDHQYKNAARNAGLPSMAFDLWETHFDRVKKRKIEKSPVRKKKQSPKARKVKKQKKRKKKLHGSNSESLMFPNISPIHRHRKFNRIDFAVPRKTKRGKRKSMRILSFRKRKMLDTQFRNTIDSCRMWDNRLDSLLAKYHLSKFAEAEGAQKRRSQRGTW
jgi:hypothetical protein